jgi:hypothetical protein
MTNDPLENAAKLYRDRAAKLDEAKSIVAQLRELLAGDQELADLIGQALIRPTTRLGEGLFGLEAQAGGASTATDAIRSGPYYDRIAAFFRANGNKWSSMTEISEAVGVKRNSFVGVLYTSHADQFESQPEPGKPGRRQWRLRTE